jgi:hypothetical protein
MSQLRCVLVCRLPRRDIPVNCGMGSRERRSAVWPVHQQHTRPCASAHDATAVVAAWTPCPCPAAAATSNTVHVAVWCCRKALDALDCHTQHGWTKLLKGIQDAKILQQAIIM